MSHISFSELKNWAECPWRHKLLYIDKVEVNTSNEYSSFGIATHDTVEQMLKNNIEDPYSYFDNKFTEELLKTGISEDTSLSRDMRQQIVGIFELITPSLDKYFEEKGGWELIDTEFNLFHPINEIDIEGYNFKGYIDLVIKDGNGHYHIIDWKTCSWGWDARKKGNSLLGKQLVLYKHYYAQHLGVDPRCVSTHFGLIKRTAKKDRVELFRVTSGERKTKNSLDFLSQALYNINNKTYLKNRLSCRYCPFKDTELCI